MRTPKAWRNSVRQDGHSNRLTELNLTEQLKRSISRSTKSLHAQTRVRHTACVLLRCGDLFSRTKKTLTVPLAKASVPVPPWCRRLLSLPRSHRPTLAWSDAHGSRSSARRACLRASLQERPETTPQLRKKPPLCSKPSAEISWSTHSGFWPAENKRRTLRPEE